MGYAASRGDGSDNFSAEDGPATETERANDGRSTVVILGVGADGAGGEAGVEHAGGGEDGEITLAFTEEAFAVRGERAPNRGQAIGRGG